MNKMTPSHWEEEPWADLDPYVIPRRIKMAVNGMPGVHLSLTAHQDREHCGIFVFDEDGMITEAFDGYTIGGTVFEHGQTRCPIEIMDVPDLCAPDGVLVELEVVWEKSWGEK
jgi:hypothetical protein